MNNLDLTSVKHVHFIGIGGIGMSAIARMFLLQGKRVTGSDVSATLVTAELEKHGATIFIGQHESHISEGIDLVIYTIAIPDSNVELVKARALNIPTFTYPEMLGLISKEKYTIAVSGTHGKTTTTAMIAKILMDSAFDPTVIVGSLLKDQKSNFIAGKSKYFVAEACEYKRSFLNLHPNILVITNIDDDHLDYYKDIADIQSAFKELSSRLSTEDYLICDPNDGRLQPVIRDLTCTIIDYTSVDAAFDLKIPGEHNKKNAKAALAVAGLVGVPQEKALASLQTFGGTWRRFEHKGMTPQGAIVYDDYAHHPTEVKATLAGAKELFPQKRIVVAFQPHLYSRTKDHLEEFAHAFKDAHTVLIAPIYAAREPFDPSISAEIVAQKVKFVHGGDVHAYLSLDDMTAALNTSLTKDDVLITMGAGDISTVAEALIAPIAEKTTQNI